MKQLYLAALVTGTSLVALPSIFSAETEAEPVGEDLSRSHRGLKEIQLPDGAVQVDLDGRFLMRSVARIDGNGEITTACVGSDTEQERFLDAASQVRRMALEEPRIADR